MRRPPDPQLLDFLSGYDPSIAELALQLRQIILEEAPDANESIYQVYELAIWFGFDGKMKEAWFCYLTVHSRHINLGFPRGAELPDPNRVLLGEGKTMRHIRIANASNLERPFICRYIQAAIEQYADAAASGGSGRTVVKGRATVQKPAKERIGARKKKALPLR